MGLLANDVHTLVELYSRGAPIRSVVTLGRQWLMCSREKLTRILIVAGISGDSIRRLLAENLTFAEPLFKVLGAKTVDSIDYSDFEGASIVHDLNQPVP